MRPEDGPRVPTKSCTYKGRVCTALDKKNKKWKYVAHSEAEAELMSDAVDRRGWVLEKFWSTE
jgi:hypothetical protein